MALFFLLGVVCCVFFICKFNIYNHNISFFWGWILILVFIYMPISDYHRAISEATIYLILIFLFSYTLGSRIARSCFFYQRAQDVSQHSLAINERLVTYLFLFFLLSSFLNIALAGYIPLVKLFVTGDSGYVDFGVKGLYGFYLAFSNALCALFVYLYVITNKKKYLYWCLIIIFFFFIFLTRQNIISVLVEAFVVYGLSKKRVSRFKILLYVFLVLLLFSFLGDLRTSDIENVLDVSSDFEGLPSIVYWLYSYFYLSAVNLDNAVISPNYPYYDFSSFSTLFPSFLRSYLGLVAEHENVFQIQNFNVSTALLSLYGDYGYYEVCFLSFVFGFLTSYYYQASLSKARFFYIASYSTLFFCAVFSFFVNFWFYLPIIFQIPFFYLFERYVMSLKYKKSI